MKLRILYIIICAIAMSANQVLALNYQNSFMESSQSSKITDSQLSAAKLLQNYVESYKNKINLLHKSYGGEKSIVMSNFNFQTGKMYVSLNDIQKNKYNSKTSSEIMSEIVGDLKTINTKMKIFLEQEKVIYLDSVKKKQKELGVIGKQISQTLDDLLLSVSNQLIKKNQLSAKEKKIVESLAALREQNNRMKNFTSNTFTSHDEMNSYLRSLIGSIRLEFKKIRTL